MANEYLRLRDTKMNKEKAENVLAIVNERHREDARNGRSENSLLTELFKAFKDFFSNLGKPSLKLKLQKKTAPAISSEFNDTMREIRDDVKVGYSEVNSLGDVLVKNFNYGESERQSLLNKIRKINSKAIDYSFYSIAIKDKALYATDNFLDRSKIDYSKIGDGSNPAELALNQGAVTLMRTGNVDKSPLATKVTGIQESLLEWDPNTETGGFEGLYFGLKGEARAEGGEWQIQYAEEGNRLYIVDSPEQKLMPNRMLMFDANPDTFWECELVSDVVVGYKNKYTGNQITVAEFKELRENELTSQNVTIHGDTIVTDKSGSLIEDFIPVSQAGETSFLKVDFTVHLDELSMINWINLNPNNFGVESYLDVYSIQTSSDGQTFNELEGFDDHEFDLTLTKEANEELTPNQVSDTLSPDKFKFAGQGLWTFAPREAIAIKFSLRQPQSYIKPYDILKVETKQQVTTTTTTKRFWGLIKSTKTSTSTITRVISIPYLVGLISGFDVMDLEPGKIDLNAPSGFNLLGGVAGYVVGGLIFGPIGAVVGFLLGGLFGSKKTETTYGEERMSRQWTETMYDKSRFAIGIRDIGLYSYTFAEKSELVSKSYISPKPVYKLNLGVDEYIPKVFYESSSTIDTKNDWIKYYISVDDATTWYRISPIHHNDTMSEDGVNRVPEVININSDISLEDRENPLAYIDTPEPVYEVRFKAVLSRPEDIDDAENYTPVLSRYGLKIFPFGGL